MSPTPATPGEPTASPPAAPPNVAATGERSIAVGGDVINSWLVTGNNNVFLVGRYERLTDAYLNPLALYAELDQDGFTGREWLAEEVEHFVAAQDRGYVVIEAEAGLGKTAFLAWLARRKGYVHHFVRLPRGAEVEVAVKNLSAQLIRVWNLEGLIVGGVLPPDAGRSDFLYEVLVAAAEARDRLRPEQPIVLVVDGLDEARADQGQNPLGLPVVLPRKVFVVATQRPVDVSLHLEVPYQVLTIEADGAANLADMRGHLIRRAQTAPIEGLLADSEMSTSEFVDTLLARSGGVWVYLHYVLAEVARGDRSPADVGLLPQGLWQYYARYWLDWRKRHDDSWFEVDLPVLTALAAAAEPVTAGFLGALIGQSSARIDDLLGMSWRPFVQVDDDGPTYRLFHASLREFCEGKVRVRTSLQGAERALAGILERETTASHRRIADHFLARWGGLAAGLPELRDGVPAGNPHIDDGYGLRHVVKHLDRAGERDVLHDLLDLSWIDGDAPTNAWFAVHRGRGDIASYQRDVSYAGEVARLDGAYALQVRYLLISCSLNSLAAASPPALWSMLVGQGRLASEEALAHIRQIPTAPERAEALSLLLDVVPAESREPIEREALAAVAAVADGFWRVGELWRLHSRLPERFRNEELVVLRGMADPYYRLVASRLLGIDMDVRLPAVVREHESSDSPSGLAASGDFVAAYTRRREVAVTRLRSVAGLERVPGRGLEDPDEIFWQAHVAMADAASGQDAETLDRTARLGWTIGDRLGLLPVWAALGVTMAGSGHATAAVQIATGLADPLQRAAVLVGTATASPAAVPDPLADAGDDSARVVVLRAAAVGTPGTSTPSLCALSDLIAGPELRAETLLAIARRAVPEEEGRICGTVVALLAGLPRDDRRADLLAQAVTACPQDRLPLAAAAAEEVVDAQAGSALRAAIGVRYCDLGDVRAARSLVSATDPPWRGPLLRGIALAIARSPSAAEAVDLADELPYVAWRAEVLVTAAHRLEEAAAGSAVARAVELAQQLTGSAQVAVLAHTALEGPAGFRDQVLDVARRAAGALTDSFDRSLAELAICTALARSGEPADAVTVASGIATEQVRADALVTVVEAAGKRGGGALAADVVAAVLAVPMEDAASRARLRAALLTATPAGAPAERLASSLDDALAALRSRPRAELLEVLPGILATAGRLGGAGTVPQVAGDLAAVIRWWP